MTLTSIDTSQSTGADRIKLYKDGALLENSYGTIAQYKTVDIANDDTMFLLNRTSGTRSFVGELYYFGMYNTPLTSSQISDYATILSTSDDKW